MWLVPKTFQGLHFLFSGPLSWWIDFELFDNETNLTLREHGKTCPDYQETIIPNICPFCATQIDECNVEVHHKFR